MNAVLRVLLVSLFGLAFAHGAGPATFQPQDPGAEDPIYFPVPVIGSVAEFSATIKIGDETRQGTMKVITEKEEQILGQKFIKQVAELPGFEGLEHVVSFSRYADDGIHIIDGRKMNGPEYVNPPFPVSIGKEWSYTNPSSGDKTQCKAEGIEDVKVGDKTYRNCLKVSATTTSLNGPKMVLEIWYAPKLAEVKITMKVATLLDVEFLLTKPAAVAK